MVGMFTTAATPGTIYVIVSTARDSGTATADAMHGWLVRHQIQDELLKEEEEEPLELDNPLAKPIKKPLLLLNKPRGRNGQGADGDQKRERS